MTELDQLIKSAFVSEGAQEDVNKVYLTLLRTTLFLPVKKIAKESVSEDEPFSPLYAKVEDKYFMAVFDTSERLKAWAGDQFSEMDVIEIMGKELIAGINEQVYLCLNVGNEFYKEFSPDEIKRLKTVVSRIDQLMQ